MTEIARIKTRPKADPQAPRGPACVRIRGVRCRCFECRCYLTTAHVVRGERGAFCADCCPACRGLRTPTGVEMPHERCTVTSRLAGPCARCRQAAWPAHARGLLIYCEACCGCGRGGAQAAGTDAAPATIPPQAGPGHDAGHAHAMPLGRATGRAIALERGVKARSTTPPAPRVSGAVSGPAQAILRGDLLGAAARFRLPPACRPRGPRPGRLALAAMPPALAAPQARAWGCCRPGRPAGVALAGPASQGQAQVPAALRGKTILRRNVSAQNFVEEWRFV